MSHHTPSLKFKPRHIAVAVVTFKKLLVFTLDLLAFNTLAFMSSQTMSNPDWEPTLRSRNFLGCSDTSSPPAGTQLLCINNTVVACSGDSNTKNKVVSLTILGVRSVGWSSVPWSKKGKTKKDAEKIQTKPLFEVERYDGEPNREKVIGAVRVYSYQKEGGTDKGLREDSSFSVVKIGQVGCIVYFCHFRSYLHRLYFCHFLSHLHCTYTPP